MEPAPIPRATIIDNIKAEILENLEERIENHREEPESGYLLKFKGGNKFGDVDLKIVFVTRSIEDALYQMEDYVWQNSESRARGNFSLIGKFLEDFGSQSDLTDFDIDNLTDLLLIYYDDPAKPLHIEQYKIY